MITANNIQKFIDFGATYIYEVRYINKITWKVECRHRTFNEDYAKVLYQELIDNGFTADVFKLLVHFDHSEKTR